MALILYHGSDYNFSKFSFKNMGKKSGTTGAGFGLYFTTDKTDAFTYGDIIYECSVDIRNNLSKYKVTLNRQKVTNIIDKLYKQGFDFYSNFGFETPSFKAKTYCTNMLINENDSDTELIGDLINAGAGVDRVLEIISGMSYTHTQDFDTPDSKDIQHYIMYDLSKIRIIDKNKII